MNSEADCAHGTNYLDQDNRWHCMFCSVTWPWSLNDYRQAESGMPLMQLSIFLDEADRAVSAGSSTVHAFVSTESVRQAMGLSPRDEPEVS